MKSLVTRGWEMEKWLSGPRTAVKSEDQNVDPQKP